MSYVIYTSSGTVLTTVPAGKVNTSTTSLFLVGKDTLNYGRYINQNLVNMLTNFANAPTRPPANPQQGQLWFDSTFNKLRIYTNGSNFELVNQAKFSQTQPVGQEPGELWFDLERRNLNFLDDQGQYQAITSFPRDTVVGWVAPKSAIYDNDTTATNRKYVTLLESYGRVVGALSTSTFIADTDTSLNVFSKANTDEFTVIDGLTIIGGFRASGDVRFGTLVVESSATSLDSVIDNSIYTVGGLGVSKDLLVNGDMVVRGSVKVDGTQVIINSTQTAIIDPVIDIGTGIDNSALTIADVCDKGIIIHYNELGGLENDNHAFMGYEHTQGKFMFKKNIYPGGHEVFPFDDFLNTGTYASVDVGALNLHGGVVTGDLVGNVTGDVTGDLTGNVTGDVTGNVTGDLTGNVTGNVVGNVLGNTTGTHTGAVIGNVTGNLSNGTVDATTARVTSLGVGTPASGTTGEIRASGNITAFYSSDKKFKENVADIENALGIVTQVGGKTFNWTDEYIADNGGEDGYFVRKNDFGVIAQDLEQAFPVAVRTRDDGSLSVDYEKLVAVAFAAIKDLTAKVNELEKKLGKE